MKNFIVETYYTCTFKTVHTLNDLNESELSKIDNRTDGSVEVIDVKLNNRKTKKIGEKKSEKPGITTSNPSLKKNEKGGLNLSKKDNFEKTKTIHVKNNSRFRMPDRRKGYIQKAQIGDHKSIFILVSMTMEKLVRYLLIQIKREN